MSDGRKDKNDKSKQKMIRVNRKGVTRIVIELKTVVVKIPNFTCQWNHFLLGVIGNIQESQTWKWNSGLYEKGTSHLLCPVLWCSWGGWILVMQKAKTLSRQDWENMQEYTTEHRKHYGGDDNMANYGILNGKLVKLDYAEPKI